MKKYILVFAVIFGLLTPIYATDLEVGDFIETKKEFANHCGSKPIIGIIKKLTYNGGGLRYTEPVATLDNGEQISCYWLNKARSPLIDQKLSCIDGYCACKCEPKTQWYVGQWV